MVQKLIMPETPEAALGNMLLEDLKIAERVIKLIRPATPEALLDLKEVNEAYEIDEYMPYWATIWPVSLELAKAILGHKELNGLRAIEIGCGLGIPGIAALMAGLEVTFSDYDETAVRFAGENARLNGLSNFKLLPMDWRDPIDDRFDVVIASDVVYEARLVQPVVEALDRLLAPEGLILLADQNRAYADRMQQALLKRGFQIKAESAGIGTVYRIRRSCT